MVPWCHDDVYNSEQYQSNVYPSIIIVVIVGLNYHLSRISNISLSTYASEYLAVWASRVARPATHLLHVVAGVAGAAISGGHDLSFLVPRVSGLRIGL